MDLTKGLADGPINHGFDFFHGTSRSHPTSKDQGWLYGDTIPAALGGLNVDRSKYVLKETGPKNFEMAMKFLDDHFNSQTKRTPAVFSLLCLPLEPHQPRSVQRNCGTAGSGASQPGGKRSDFIYENDVVLGLMLEYLERQDDPRRPGSKLMENTLVVFTSDNGAENKAKTATGPIRSNKGSVYEGGHRVPFIAAWQRGGIGDGNSKTDGQTSDFPIAHVDLFATLAEITGRDLPNDGAEDTFSILAALRNNPPAEPTSADSPRPQRRCPGGREKSQRKRGCLAGDPYR